MSDHNPPADDLSVSDNDNSQLEENLKSRSTWLRGLFMLVYCFTFSLAVFVGTFVVVLGFLWVLFKGEINPQLQQTGRGITAYVYQIGRYLTFNSNDKPFPFGEDWPSGDA